MFPCREQFLEPGVLILRCSREQEVQGVSVCLCVCVCASIYLCIYGEIYFKELIYMIVEA